MATLIHSYSESNADYNSPIYSSAANIQCGQSFSNPNSITLDSCKFYLNKEGSPPGNIVAKLYAHTGTFGSTGVPTGSALATSDAVSASSLGTSSSLITFSFSGANRITLDASTNYVILLEYSSGNASNLVNVRICTGTHTDAGNRVYSSNGTSWTYNEYDCAFYIYGEITSTAYTKSFTDTLTMSENFSKSTGRYKTLTDTLTISDTIQKSISVIKLETIILSDNIRKFFSTVKSEMMSLSDSFTKNKIKIINLIDTLNLSESIQKSIAIVKSETQTLTDSLSKSIGYFKSLSDTLNLSDNVQKAFSSVKSEIMTLSEVFSKNFVKFINLTDTLNLSENFSKVKGYFLSLSDNLNLSDSIQKAFATIKTETITLTDSIRKFINGMEAIWTKATRVVSTAWSNRSKPTTSWSNRSKPTTPWTKRDKPWD